MELLNQAAHNISKIEKIIHNFKFSLSLSLSLNIYK